MNVFQILAILTKSATSVEVGEALADGKISTGEYFEIAFSGLIDAAAHGFDVEVSKEDKEQVASIAERISRAIDAKAA